MKNVIIGLFVAAFGFVRLVSTNFSTLFSNFNPYLRLLQKHHVEVYLV